MGHNNWKWEFREHKHSAVHRSVPLIACTLELPNGQNKSVFWPGDGKIYEMHTGKHNNFKWEWDIREHEHSTVCSTVPLAACASNQGNMCNKSVFWPGDGVIYEMRSGKQNNWKWEFREHEHSAACSTVPLAACASNQGNMYNMSVFWPGDSEIHEMHVEKHDDWKWEFCEHEHSAVRSTVPLADCASKQGDMYNKSVFWLGDGKVHEMHTGKHNEWTWAWTELHLRE